MYFLTSYLLQEWAQKMAWLAQSAWEAGWLIAGRPSWKPETKWGEIMTFRYIY